MVLFNRMRFSTRFRHRVDKRTNHLKVLTEANKNVLLKLFALVTETLALSMSNRI